MVLGLSLRVSWICLLLFSSGACFPSTKGDYRYPYTATWNSGGEAAPGTNFRPDGLRPPLVSLHPEPSTHYQQPEAAPQQTSSPAGNQSPSSLGAPSVAASSLPSYEPNRFIVNYDYSSDKPSSAPEVPSQGAGYVSPPVGILPPASAGKETPSFSMQVASTGGNSNMGSDVETSSPFYEASPFPPSGLAYPAKTAGNMAPLLDFGDGPVPYAPTYDFGDGPVPYAPTYDFGDGPVPYAPTYDFGDGPVPYANGPVPYANAPTYDFGDGPAPYGNPSSEGSLPRDEQPEGGAYASIYDPSRWVPHPFSDFSLWDSNDEMPQSVSETSPLPPSSYIIQSRNGYQRAREVYSNTKYSPEYPQPPVFPYKAIKAPSKSPPMTGSKGGKKVY